MNFKSTIILTCELPGLVPPYLHSIFPAPVFWNVSLMVCVVLRGQNAIFIVVWLQSLTLITRIISTHSKSSEEVDGKWQINDASAQNKKEMPNQCVEFTHCLSSVPYTVELIYRFLCDGTKVILMRLRENHRENRSQGVVLQSASTGKEMGGKCQHGKNRPKQKSSLWRGKNNGGEEA